MGQGLLDGPLYFNVPEPLQPGLRYMPMFPSFNPSSGSSSRDPGFSSRDPGFGSRDHLSVNPYSTSEAPIPSTSSVFPSSGNPPPAYSSSRPSRSSTSKSADYPKRGDYSHLRTRDPSRYDINGNLKTPINSEDLYSKKELKKEAKKRAKPARYYGSKDFDKPP